MSDSSASIASHLNKGAGAPRAAPALPAQATRSFSCDRSVPQLISDQAIQNPGRTALVDDSIQLTYDEFEARSARLAAHLQALGVSANIVVAVCMRRSALMAVAALAVLKAGGAYLPIDSNYPRERLSFVLRDANVPIVLSDSSVADRLPEGRWRLILLDGDAKEIESAETARRPIQISPDHLSYVIYTSGSTGTPKGVGITHENLLNLVFWQQKAFGVSTKDRTTQFTSFGFDAAVAELWPNLTAGAAVHITPDEIRSSPELLRDWLVRQEITISFVPTVMAERLITLDWPVTAKLRFLVTGADTLHHYPRPGLPFVLVNEYGPTEATVVATFGPVGTEKKDHERRPPIGRPIDGVDVYILDQSLQFVPCGESGEIYVGGAGVGQGYVNSPELTAKKFVPDPFSKRPQARMYRTGDMACWLPDGQIEYIGRVDNLIKIRGYRIEPDEIVSVLNVHPAIEASAVVARTDASRRDASPSDSAESLRLLAYITVHRGHRAPSAGELRSLLRTRLPDYMVPAMFFQVAELPVNPNGKLDRDALPAPENTNVLPDDSYVPPDTVLEARLSELVSELLGLKRVGINDNFFLIGGHSLFGTQLIARIRDSFGVELSLRSVFESPTPALLAQEIEKLMVTKIEALTEDEVRNALEQARSGAGNR